MASTHISRLTLTNFRNYQSLSLDLQPGAVVFTGDNGAGKTNLLEAISFLTPGRGLRRAPYGDVAREGSAGGFTVHARIEGEFGDVEIGTGTSGSDLPGEAGRRVRINGANAKSADEMLDWLRVVWLTMVLTGLGSAVRPPIPRPSRYLFRLTLSAVLPLPNRSYAAPLFGVRSCHAAFS